MTADIVTVYHNPRCGKSRAALALLAERGIEPRVVEYLKEPLSRDELKALLAELKMPARDLVRRGEPVCKELYAGGDLDDDAWLDAMVDHPILMERPIVVRGARAVVARPTEKLLDLV